MGGGGGGRLRKKNFRLWFQVKKILRPKNSPAWLRKPFRTPKPVFALQNPPFAVRNLLSQSKICFSHSVNCFTHSKSTLYLGNDFSHYKKEVFLGKRKILKKNYGKWRTWMLNPPPPPGLMKRALGGFKKNNPARRAGEKKISCSKNRQKNSPAHLSLPAPPPPPHKNQNGCSLRHLGSKVSDGGGKLSLVKWFALIVLLFLASRAL